MPTLFRSQLPTLLSVLLVLGPATSCGEESQDDQQVRTAANGDEFNDADVEFATGMIQHHAQALTMVDLTLGRDLDPELVRLAEQIRDAQGPEIELMTDWLVAWDEEVPETVRDHANAHGDGHATDDQPGTMSGEDLEGLEAATGEAFETMWLEMMIEHHEGAIEMAETEKEDGHHGAALDLADAILESQSAEITTMESLLA